MINDFHYQNEQIDRDNDMLLRCWQAHLERSLSLLGPLNPPLWLYALSARPTVRLSFTPSPQNPEYLPVAYFIEAFLFIMVTPSLTTVQKDEEMHKTVK